MNKDRQRIKIGEACGWKCTVSFKEAFACWVRPGAMEHQTERLPDYLNDLNACAEFEKILSVEQKQDYVRILCSIMNGWNSMPDFSTTFATAEQKCEAVLKTCGLWEDSE